MISYPFIEELFKNVLQSSRAIGGRFYVSSNYAAREINSDTLSQVITESLNQEQKKKVPFAIMLPPRSRGEVKYRTNEFEQYNIRIAFLKTSYYDSNNQLINPNLRTLTSQHTILQDWHDMKRPAVNFLRVVDKMQRTSSGLVNIFRLDPTEKLFTPVSFVGTDRLSGVLVEFSVSLFSSCDIEDYDESDLINIQIPAVDSHPEHQL